MVSHLVWTSQEFAMLITMRLPIEESHGYLLRYVCVAVFAEHNQQCNTVETLYEGHSK